MRILLTGPFGTIGSVVLQELLKRQHTVTCFDLDNKLNRKKAAKLGDRIRMVWGDITAQASVSAAVANQDAVIHLAALIPPMSEQRPELAYRINVDGTANIIRAIDQQANKPLLVFPSSISVHGFSKHLPCPCNVDMPLKAEDHYAGHKIACEGLLRDSTIPWVILRIGACVGTEIAKGGDADSAMQHALSLAPDTPIEYLHPQDAALAMANALETPAVVGKTLFLGSGPNSQIRWQEFLSILPRAMGVGELPPEAFGTAPYYTNWMDTRESEALLKFQRHGLPAYREEVAKKWRWFRALNWPIRPLIRKQLLKHAANRPH